jgi:F-type H+-transporting ATPase subunit b
MLEILNNFGINPLLTGFQVLNFLVVFYILKRFLYPPLLKMLKKRQELAKETLAKAEESRRAFEKAQKEEKEILKEAHANANQILQDAKEQSQEIIKRAEDEAKKQADHILQTAKEQIVQETKDAEATLSRHVARLSVELLKKSLTNVFSEKEQKELIDRAVKELKTKPN